MSPPHGPDEALAAYAGLHMGFVRVHPFSDGNGRRARLLANLPVLSAGLPPVLIDRTRRQEPAMPLAVPCPEMDAFRQFCGECWQAGLDLVGDARRLQAGRGAGDGPCPR